MLEKPDLDDARLAAHLRDAYGVAVADLAFLPLGADPHAGVYRVEAEGGARWFLKAKRGGVDEASLAVPHHLATRGVARVVAPLPSRDGALWGSLDGFALILYPFVEGEVAAEVGLSDRQWVEYGAAVRAVHEATLDGLPASVRREGFAPKHAALVRDLDREVARSEGGTGPERDLVRAWRERRSEILQVVERAERLGRRLRGAPPPFVLCHADIHLYNVLVDRDGRLHVVDWDEALLAPRERDLMFVNGGVANAEEVERTTERFFHGYGAVAVDPVALAYVRHEWVVQEFGEFGAQVLRGDAGAETRAWAARHFRALFDPGGVVEAAHRAGAALPDEGGA